MNPKFRNCFLFLLPYVCSKFLTLCARTFFDPDGADPFMGLSVTSFSRLSALENLSLVVYVIGLYELAKCCRDKLVFAFSATAIFSFYYLDLVNVLFNIRYCGLAVTVCHLLILIAICVVCLWMLVRINRVKKIANAAIISAIVLIAPFVIREIPTRPTALTEFLSDETFLNFCFYIVEFIVPVVILGLYLRYCAEPKSVPAKVDF